jgi:hypothetical protein
MEGENKKKKEKKKRSLNSYRECTGLGQGRDSIENDGRSSILILGILDSRGLDLNLELGLHRCVAVAIMPLSITILVAVRVVTGVASSQPRSTVNIGNRKALIVHFDRRAL